MSYQGSRKIFKPLLKGLVMHFKEVKDPELWKRIQFSFLEAMVIFFFTILIGLFNAVDLVDFSKAELLFHLHSGTIGWLSLCAVTILVWYFGGDRDLDEDSTKMAKNILRYIQIVIPIYVVSFYIALTFAEGEDFLRIIDFIPAGKGWFAVMVIGALAVSFGFGWSFFFGFKELGKIEVVMTPHWLFLGAMLTSTYGGLVGMVLELQHALDALYFGSHELGRGAHAAAMEAGYLYMFIAGVLEWQILGGKGDGITLSGKIQTAALFLAGLFTSIVAGTDIEIFGMISMPLLLLGFGLLLFRIIIKVNPRTLIGTTPERFYLPAALAIFYSMGFFLYAISKLISAEEGENPFGQPFLGGLALANIHSLFIGGATGVIFAVVMVMLKDADHINKRLENLGFILMYVGLLGFMLTLIYRGLLQQDVYDDNLLNDTDEELPNLRTDIAALMGTGLYLLLYTIYTRFKFSRSTK
jgi:hypothetical protein